MKRYRLFPVAGGAALAVLFSGSAQQRPPSVQVVEFSDFTCSYCRQFALAVEPALRKEFVATGRVRWTFVAMTRARPTGGEPAARAADCVDQQHKNTAGMRDLLFRNQREWLWSRRRDSLLESYAVQSGVDRDLFYACIRSPETTARIKAANRRAAEMHVRTRPTFFVNGTRVEGALPLPEFRSIILSALQQERK